MGQLACAAIAATTDLELVARCGRKDDLAARIRETRAEVVVDFTLPDAVERGALAIVEAGARPIIGTSGMTAEARARLAQRCAERRIGGLIAPNFAIGALLMMRFAELAARWMPAVEIVEAHHAAKRDAPSGTAIATADRIAAARAAASLSPPAPATPDLAARGEQRHAIALHSLRLPGVVAEQSVVFGDTGQKLVIEHVTYGRDAYMPGVLLACRRVMALDHLVVGLDALLFGSDGTSAKP
jgi:4-hydroxy-tetrahydrodipicolinate reductase